ncbi:MAG TPA: hypothetical protein VG821_06230 [Rhizomicrobium sp.]|mgnify:FL=1|jgi:hypothetical protein|nr:hypothetical protein [Rhizomicrobium sp.]
MRAKRPLVLIAVIAACTTAVYWVVNFDPCTTELAQAIPSPDGEKTLVIFHRDCGATVDFNTHLSVTLASQKFSFDQFPPVFSVGGEKLRARWISSDEIEITRPAGERIYRQGSRSGNVSIVYR